MISALLLIIAFAPLFVIIALAVKASSPGPTFFRQKRYGWGGRTFWILKFRTMYWTPSSAEIDIQAIPKDPRITPFGRLLRKTSLDEIPQLINVLRGDMSLVGPRPHAISLDHKFAPLIPHYGLRFNVRPGITGLAQVNGSRGATSTLSAMRLRIAFDSDYVQNASLALDMRICVSTVVEMFFSRTAY